tara:strand:- start:1624 stop:2514 length:891 start_codon:yes stop_codon:yes gene_type:complete
LELVDNLQNHYGNRFKMLLLPNLLKKSARRQPTRVFLCGPGLTAGNVDVRESAKAALQSIECVEVTYGEHIENIPGFNNLKTDLQSLEYLFAYTTDFTVLILDSPGAIAELGAFSMIPNIRRRLIVLVPSRFHNQNSYINRGPLSLLARIDPNSIIYYEPNKHDHIKTAVKRTVTTYKFMAESLKRNYRSVLENIHGFSEFYYESYTKEARESFNLSAIYATILARQNPTFIEISTDSSLSPEIVRQGLKQLFSNGSVEKRPNGTYSAKSGFSSVMLKHFSSYEVSKLRCRIAAGN